MNGIKRDNGAGNRGLMIGLAAAGLLAWLAALGAYATGVGQNADFKAVPIDENSSCSSSSSSSSGGGTE